MQNFKAVIEERSPFTAQLVDLHYMRTHQERIKELLERREAAASRIDLQEYTEFINDIIEDWDDSTHMACSVSRKNDNLSTPISIAIATKRIYRDDVRRPTELNWARTNEYRRLEEQWCVEYLVRAARYRGSGVGCIAIGGLLEGFRGCFDEGMLWLLLAGGFVNRNALSLYTDVGFLVTSLDSDKTPIMSLQVQDIGQRARRKVVDTLTLRYGRADAGRQEAGHDDQGGAVGDGGGDGDGSVDGDGAGDGGGDGAGDAGGDGVAAERVDDAGDGGDLGAVGGDGDNDDYRRRLRRRRRRRQLIVARRRRPNIQRPRRAVDNLRFRTIEQHLQLVSGQLVLPPQAEGHEEDLLRHLWSMSDRAALNPQSQSFLIHLNVAKQCHLIASQRRLHVSRWIAEQRQENRDNDDWNRRFASCLAADVLLLWSVFRMPCLALLEIGYAAACRPGGVRDIARYCENLLNDGQPLPHPILVAQQQLHK